MWWICPPDSREHGECERSGRVFEVGGIAVGATDRIAVPHIVPPCLIENVGRTSADPVPGKPPFMFDQTAIVLLRILPHDTSSATMEIVLEV